MARPCHKTVDGIHRNQSGNMDGDTGMKYWIKLIVAVCVIALCAHAAHASLAGFGQDQAGDVNSRTGNASPTGGAGSSTVTATGVVTNAAGTIMGQGTATFDTVQNNSRIDDYINQDEQINITPQSGVVKVLRTNQKNLINDYVTALIPLENPNQLVTVNEILRAMKTATGKEGGRAESVRDQVQKKAFMQVIAPVFQIPYLEQAVKALDEPWVQDSLDGFEVVEYKVMNRDANDIAANAAAWGGGEGTTNVDTINNTIVRRTEPFRAAIFRSALKSLDVPPNQIMLEGAIYEVNRTDTLKLGLDYIAWKNGPGRNLFDFAYARLWSKSNSRGITNLYDPVASRSTALANRNLSAFGQQIYGSFNFLATAAYYDFLATKGKARVVCRPKIVATSNELASFSSTDQIVSFLQRPDNITRLDDDPGGARVMNLDNRSLNHSRSESTVNRIQTNLLGVQSIAAVTVARTIGCTMTVVPQIGTETSEVAIDVTFSVIGGTTPQGAPIINTRQLTTTVRVADGKPLVIGGLKRNERVERDSGMPLLGTVKFLKHIFGGTEESENDTDFIIVLTPKVIIGAASDLASAEDQKTIELVKSKDMKLPMPVQPWGYDMWLLKTVNGQLTFEKPVY